jgi:hypothetical protein
MFFNFLKKNRKKSLQTENNQLGEDGGRKRFVFK